jgi:hypothetical protein
VWGLAIGVPVAAALAYILWGPDSGQGGPRRKKGKKVVEEKAKEVAKEEVKSVTAAASPAKEEVGAAGLVPRTLPQVEVEDVPEEPADPFDQAVAAKNRGNKYFRGGR